MIPKPRIFFMLWTLIGFLLIFSLPDYGGRPLHPETPRAGGILRVRVFSDVFKPDLDPASGSWAIITEQIFDGLVRLDNDFSPVPSLAEYWNISEDKRRYTFFLRRGVRFHDGREMTSEDVKFSLERLVRRETNCPFREYFLQRVVGAQEFYDGKTGDVAGFKAPEKYVFEVHWRTPYPSALLLLSMSSCKILPRELVLAQGKNFFWKPIGTGPFKFDHWLRSPKLEIVGAHLERNYGYFGGGIYLQALEFSPYFTEDHFMERETDVIPFFSDRLARAGCQVLVSEPRSLSFLLLSCQIPPMDRLGVRKALAFGIDKEKLAAAAGIREIFSLATGNFIPSDWPGFFPKDDTIAYDPEMARQILYEQGFSEKKFPELILYLPAPRNDAQIRFSAELGRELEKLDISVSVKYYQSLPEIRDQTRPFLIKADWPLEFPDPENIILPLFSSRSPINIANGRYVNPRLDSLLEESERESSWSRRTELFRQMERNLEEDLPAIPLFMNEPRIAVQPYVRGLKIPSLGFDYLDVREVWLDKKE
jgi:ABC-type transport system substrate-binding protein